MVQRTPLLNLPYIEPTDTPVTYPATNSELVGTLDRALVVPNPSDVNVDADQTITSTAVAETPTQVRNTIVNPHPTRRLVVQAMVTARLVPSGTAGLVFLACRAISGQNTMPVASSVACMSTAGEQAGRADCYYWVPAGGTMVIGISAWKSVSGTTYVIRMAHTSLIPLHFE